MGEKYFEMFLEILKFFCIDFSVEIIFGHLLLCVIVTLCFNSKKTWIERISSRNNDEWKIMSSKFEYIFSNIYILFWILWNIVFSYNFVWWSSYQFHIVAAMWHSWHFSVFVAARSYWTKRDHNFCWTCFGDKLYGRNIFAIL